MKTTTSMRLAALSLLFTGATLLFATNGCNQGAEGDRCNPDLAAGESDCDDGLTCTIPPLCPEAYCCPNDGTTTSPFCMTGCAGGQASICDAGGDADCSSLGGG